MCGLLPLFLPDAIKRLINGRVFETYGTCWSQQIRMGSAACVVLLVLGLSLGEKSLVTSFSGCVCMPKHVIPMLLAFVI